MMILLIVATPLKKMLDCKVFNFLGNISFELYAVHGAVLTILRSSFIWIDNDLLFLIMVIIISIAFARILSSIFKKIDKRVRDNGIELSFERGGL